MNDRQTLPLTDRLRRMADRWPWLGGLMRWAYAWVSLARHRRETHETLVSFIRQFESLSQRLDRVEEAQGRLDQAVGRLDQAVGRVGQAAEQLAAAQSALQGELPNKADRDALPELERRLLGVMQTVTGDAHRHWNLQHTVLLRQVLERLGGGDPQQPLPGTASQDSAPDDFQWALAEEFRGSKDAIRARLQGYVDTVRAAALRLPDKSLIDLGCGRGEWLELLRDSGLDGLGVDGNPLAIEQCRHNGLAVEEGDILAWLRARPSGEAAVISGFHIVEHLAPGPLLALLKEAWRVLAPNGLLLLETPNPENLLVATRMFHRDPTHRAPLPPELLDFMVRWAGFREVRVLRLSPYPESCRLQGDDPATRALDELLHGPQDYAVLAQAG